MGDDILVTIILTSLVTAILMCMVFAWVDRRANRRKHEHDWTGWSEWSEGVEQPETVVWERQRICRTCNETEYQHAGRHRCLSTKNPKARCDHWAGMAALFDDRTTQLERDLGMLGDGR